MNTRSGATRSLWMAAVDTPELPVLNAPIHCDVCIIGAGIAGLTTAYLLLHDGLDVVILDDGPLGGGETSRSTAHLSNEIDDRYTTIERIHGPHAAMLAAEAHTSAIHRIEMIVKEEGFDCDFERLDGYLFLDEGQPRQQLHDELEAARRAGLVQSEILRRAPLAGFDTGPCIRFLNQAQFHPLKYMAALARVVLQRGGKILRARAKGDFRGGNQVCVNTFDGPAVTAASVLVATNSPINERIGLHTRQSAHRTYVICARIPHGSVQRALFWDMAQPYHYVRLAAAPANHADEYDMLIVGGEDHKTGQEPHPDSRWAALETWARKRFDMIQSIDFRWSGQVMETLDGLAYIGNEPSGEQNVYIATGDSGMGITHGTIAGMIVCDRIMGRKNSWAEVFDPARKPPGTAGQFIRENLNVTAQYADWVTGGEVHDVADIDPHNGAIMRRGLHKIAVYRDAQGQLHAFSASCPHLGCVVSWNRAEQSWDCPCHGSRFDATGHLISGPANTDLHPVAVQEHVPT